MNKNAIKNFAIWARKKLIADISYRARLMGITTDGIHPALPQSTGQTKFYDIGTAEPYAISGESIHQREHLADLIRRKARDSNYHTAYKYIIEEVAYTWFNRLIAVRFMEVNDYLPSHIRVLSSDQGKIEPDLVTTPFDANLDFTRDEQQAILGLKDENKLDEVFRLLFIKQCNALNKILPALFEKTNDYTELLLNLSVIDRDGVVYHLVHDIPEADFDVENGGQVEIIGWLYQAYYSDPKDERINAHKKYTKDDIPFVTQLFTPEWIVRFLVENSLGKMWNEGHPHSFDTLGLEYFFSEVANGESVILNQIKNQYENINIEDFRIIDPCMGSGHILNYAFDLLLKIYEGLGYSQRDAAEKIIENNLYGIDIADRAFQLSYFSLLMKARHYSRRILNKGIKYNLYSLKDSSDINITHLNHLGSNLDSNNRVKALNQLIELLDLHKDAKMIGSLLRIGDFDWNLLRKFVNDFKANGQMSLETLGLSDTKDLLLGIVDVSEVLSRKFDVVVTNPPYVNASYMPDRLKSYVSDNYPEVKYDLYACFIYRAIEMLKCNGHLGMLTPYSWMFISSFEKMRYSLLNETCLTSVVQLETNAFEAACVPVAGFTMCKSPAVFDGNFIRLTQFRGAENQRIRTLEAIKNKKCGYRFTANQRMFTHIPGAAYAYWINDTIIDAFDNSPKLSESFDARSGLQTNDNARFLRLWYEIDYSKTSMGHGKKWYPHLKGGSFRRWYGNLEYVVNWENDGKEIIELASELYGSYTRTVKSKDKYFKPGISWSDFTSGLFSIRYMPQGCIFDTTAPTIFGSQGINYSVFALLNSKVGQYLIDLLAPTVHYNCGSLAKLPIKEITDKKIDELVKEAVELTQHDWDSKETAWDFSCIPYIIEGEQSVEQSIIKWQSNQNNSFKKLKEIEQQLNRLFIDAYALNNELNDEVDDNTVSIRRTSTKEAVEEIMSYAVGCMFGRYSLTQKGIVCADGIWKRDKYGYFAPDEDNIIPITDEEYLEDDIVVRFCEWLKAVYGEASLEKNLDFIADVLGNKGKTSREIIRSYYLNTFFKEHCQMYSVTGSGKRPIYWLFDSGKQNGFKALTYLHRYNADTIGNLRIDYLHRMQRIYESEIGRMQDIIDHSTNAREIGQATKRKDKLTKQLKECREYDEKLAHLALSRIELDLDDGVKVNYRKIQTANDGKFYEVLADSKNIMAKK